MTNLKKEFLAKSGRLGTNWANWVIKWRWLVLFLTIVVITLLGSGLPKLAFDGDYRVFFSKDNPPAGL